LKSCQFRPSCGVTNQFQSVFLVVVNEIEILQSREKRAVFWIIRILQYNLVFLWPTTMTEHPLTQCSWNFWRILYTLSNCSTLHRILDELPSSHMFGARFVRWMVHASFHRSYIIAGCLNTLL